MGMGRVQIVCFVALLAAAAAAYPMHCKQDELRLQVVSAGKSHKLGPVLKDGDNICLRSAKYPEGLTIACRGMKTENRATFYVDDAYVRTERYEPYLIAGDRNGMYYAWNWNSGTYTIKCKIDDKQVSVVVTLSCENTPVVDVDQEEASSPSSSDSSVSSSNTAPTITGNGAGMSAMYPTESGAATTTVSNVGSAKETHSTTTSIPTTTTMATTMMPATTTVRATEQAASSGNDGCVRIDVSKAELPPGWSRQGNGIVWRAGGGIHDISRPGTSQIPFYFEVPETGTYAISMDSTSMHRTEWNDFFFSLEGGIRLGINGPVLNEPVKIFTSANGRDVQGRADSRHRIASPVSGAMFTRGQTKKFTLGARSTRIVLYSVVLFPCQGMNCEVNSKYHREMRRECAGRQ